MFIYLLYSYCIIQQIAIPKLFTRDKMLLETQYPANAQALYCCTLNNWQSATTVLLRATA